MGRRRGAGQRKDHMPTYEHLQLTVNVLAALLGASLTINLIIAVLWMRHTARRPEKP